VIGGRLLVTDPKGIGGIEIEDAVIFYVDLRDTVVGRGEKERLIEADFEGAGFEVAIPIIFGVRNCIATFPLDLPVC
jgi:hypothetical protein